MRLEQVVRPHDIDGIDLNCQFLIKIMLKLPRFKSVSCESASVKPELTQKRVDKESV